MRLNRSAVIGICADAWGITPREFREAMKRREILASDVVTRVKLEVMRNPLAAAAFMDMILPGRKAKQRRDKHQADMMESFRRAARQQGKKT